MSTTAATASKLPEVMAEARMAAGLSQRKLASEYGRSVNTVSAYECRHQAVDAALVLEIGRKTRNNKALMQSLHEWSGGLYPAYPDGDYVDPHRLAYLMYCGKEDAEGDEAREKLQTLLMGAAPDRERIKACLVEIVEAAWAETQLAAIAGDWAGISLDEICREVAQRQYTVGIVRG